ncbi:predicted protein [Histoplasma capsulatum H143]|uniref:Uncharacterized protein n=1 Tax=Ajellomyces capsulatus (strain H143) TaxID=544712 RepID=C6HRK6_AJECH|nr:predicted protein [Histoplasma capsulatum H143]
MTWRSAGLLTAELDHRFGIYISHLALPDISTLKIQTPSRILWPSSDSTYLPRVEPPHPPKYLAMIVSRETRL